MNLLLVILGGFIGILIGIGLILFSHWLWNNILTTEEHSQIVRASEVGRIRKELEERSKPQ